MFGKRRYFIIAIVCLMIAVTSVVTVDEGKKWYKAGKNIKSEEDKFNNDIVVEINGYKITEKDFNKEKVMQDLTYEIQMNSVAKAQFAKFSITPTKKMDNNQILNKMIDHEVLYQEAQKEGYSISYDTAKQIMEKQSEVYDDAISGKVKYENIDQIIEDNEQTKQFAKALGMTEDEYWTSCIPAYQKACSIANLKKKIKSNLSLEDQKDINKVNAVYEQYTKELRDQYKITIYNDKLK